MKQAGNLCYKDILAGRLIAELRQAAESPPPSLLCLKVDIEDLAPADWLAVQNHPARMYWASRDGDFAAAGIGAADVLADDANRSVSAALAEIERRIAAADHSVRYYGGICFDPDDPRDPWAGFGRFRFFVPQVELRREHGETLLAVNIRRRPHDTIDSLEEQIMRILDAVIFDGGADPQTFRPARIRRRIDLPDRAAWIALVDRTLADLAAGMIDKLVLARRAILALSAPLDPVRLLDRVARGGTGAYAFCFQLHPDDAFVGASPECLYCRRGDRIMSEAVAGTALNGGPDARRRHRSILSQSVKDSEEHGWVLESVRSGLERLCSKVGVGDRGIVSLGYVQHLRSRLAGRLREGMTTADIVAALHPTAAVNGHPRPVALQRLRDCEPSGRGWYAGPVGWIGADASEFAVAIRSARLLRDQITLFAGAGIVRASDPAGEWDETESKLSLFLKALS